MENTVKANKHRGAGMFFRSRNLCLPAAGSQNDTSGDTVLCAGTNPFFFFFKFIPFVINANIFLRL